MDNSLFLDWLVTNKSMSQRASKDVLSRCKRVSKLIGEDNLNRESINKLNSSEEFNAKSMFIKSQLRRAVSLLCEYEDSTNE